MQWKICGLYFRLAECWPISSSSSQLWPVSQSILLTLNNFPSFPQTYTQTYIHTQTHYLFTVFLPFFINFLSHTVHVSLCMSEPYFLCGSSVKFLSGIELV